MPEDRNGPRSLAVGVLQMVAVIGLLSVAIGVGVHGVSGGLSETVPAAEFGYEYDTAAGTLEITHEGGDPLDAAALQVVGGDAACATDDWKTGRVAAHDTCLLEDVSRDGTVRIVWSGAGPNRATLDVWTAGVR